MRNRKDIFEPTSSAGILPAYVRTLRTGTHVGWLHWFARVARRVSLQGTPALPLPEQGRLLLRGEAELEQLAQGLEGLGGGLNQQVADADVHCE